MILIKFSLAVALSALALPAQTPTKTIAVARDPQAIALISKSLAALGEAAATASDVTIQATVHWQKGSDDESVTATFLSAGPGTSKASFNLANGTYIESRNQLSGTATNAGVAQPMSLHNALNLHEWFFPALFLKDLEQTIGYSFSTPQTQTANGESQIFITGSLVPSGDMSAATAHILANATQFKLVLDSTTFLPVSLSYTLHPDNDSLTGPPVVYQFSDYKTENGIQQPFHILKYLQGTLAQDITVQSMVLNTGLTAAGF